MEKEVWRPIKGFENYYVSNYGRVKKENAMRWLGNKVGCIGTYYVKQHAQGGRYAKTYLAVMLTDENKKQHNVYVHRLVAMAFCDGWFEGAEVNHIDNNSHNNYFENLEWCTHEYNNQYRAILNKAKK